MLIILVLHVNIQTDDHLFGNGTQRLANYKKDKVLLLESIASSIFGGRFRCQESDQ